jgi:hypothetical protein
MMCNCTAGQAHGIDEPRCGECARRAHAGPNYDPRRGTGRTSNAVKAAVLAAAFGQRVVYICGNQNSADHANALAREFVEKSLGPTYHLRVSISKERIVFYFANGGVAGTLVFRSMEAQDINLGMRKEQVFRVIEDHYAVEVRAEREAKRIRMDDCATIMRLMQKHGFRELSIPDTYRNGADCGQPTWVRK